MAILSDVQIAQYAAKGGFSGSGIVTAIAVALAESGGNPAAQGVNRNAQGKVTSIDRGLWQINSVYHSEVSDSCAFNPSCAAGQAFRISGQGANWTPWSTYTNGAYRNYTARALVAAQSVGSTSGSNATGPATQPLVQSPGNADNSPGGLLGQVAQNLLNTANAYVASQSKLDKIAFGDQTAQNFWGPFQTVVALLFMFGILYALSRTKAGYVALYYGEALILLFLFATQAQYFREGLLPFLSQQQHETGQPNAPTLVTQ